MSSGPNRPGRGPHRRPRPTLGGISTRPIVTSVDPNSDRAAGGAAITITGSNFRNENDGSAPTVLIDGSPATSIVVVDVNTITAVVPSALTQGVVDLSVTINGEIGVLSQVFSYYTGFISELVPAYGPLAGGTAVAIQGYNFVAGSTVYFGGSAGTSFVFIDSAHLVVTTPNHAVGYVDVVVEEPGGATATLRNGFKYTLLSRGADIRRNPGITIRDVLNSAPNTAVYTIDGTSTPPKPGEQVEILDVFDGSRRLFAGNILDVDQDYEGLKEQLVWHVNAVDFTWLLNRRRPFGVFNNISATSIVKDLVARFAPGFTTAFTQTNLARITCTFDGTQDFATCLNRIASGIGGGHWYVDYGQDVHFFHVAPQIDVPVIPTSPGPGTASVLAESALAMPSTSVYPIGYYYLRTSFLYSNGVESLLSPPSNLVALMGRQQMDISLLPIGVDPGSGITCVARRIYFASGSGNLRRGWLVNDNVTTDLTVYPNQLTDGVVSAETGEIVVFAASPVPELPPLGAPSVIAVPSIQTIPQPAHGDVWIKFSVSVQYGGVGMPQARRGASSAPLWLAQVTSPPTDAKFVSLPKPPQIAGSVPLWYGIWAEIAWAAVVELTYTPGRWVVQQGTTPQVSIWIPGHATYGPIGPPPDSASRYAPPVHWVDIPCYDPTATPIPLQVPNFGDRPVFGTGSAEELIWPNPDGPYLEDVDQPDDIDDSNTTLLRDPQVRVRTDLSQIRNRVTVLGAATVLTSDASIGASLLNVADVSIFSETGGQVMAYGDLLIFNAASGSIGAGTLILAQSLTRAIPSGALVQFYLQLNDKQSQAELGRIELDKDGSPTDGIHETVVKDTSFNTTTQLFMAANAELELFSRAVVKVTYATRDPKTRSGKMVNFDLTDPPCRGRFLIQDVTIDQIHDEADGLSPRYTVSASSVRFELNDLLLQLVSNRNETSVGLSGVGSVAPGGTVVVPGSSGSQDIPNKRYSALDIALAVGGGNPMLYPTGLAFASLVGTIGSFDPTEFPVGVPATSGDTGNWATFQTTTTLNNTSGFTGGVMLPLDNNIDLTIFVRTSSNITDLILWAGLFRTGVIPTNATLLGQSLACFRYASDTDAGWVGCLQTATGGITLTPAIATVLPNTVYKLRMVSSGSPPSTKLSVSFAVNDSAFSMKTYADCQVGAANTMPITGSTTNLVTIVGVVNKQGGVGSVKKFGFKHLGFLLDN